MNWKNAKDTLETLAAEPQFGLVSDLDGTLAPIVTRPEDAQLTERNRALLKELGQALPLVAVVSGRSAADVGQRVGIPGLVYVGNHGMDWLADGALQVAPEAAAYRPALEAALKQLENLAEPGIGLEDKGATLTANYRRHAQPAAFAERARPRYSQVAAEHGLRLSEGRMVFEIKPPIEVDKGSTLQSLVGARGLRAALFLGDDITDIAAFRTARQLREAGDCAAWGVAVQSEEAPEEVAATADFTSSGVEDVEALLTWLLGIRRASST